MPVPFVRYEFQNSSGSRPRVRIRAHGVKPMPEVNVVGPIEQGTTATVSSIDDVEDVNAVDITVNWDVGPPAPFTLHPSAGKFINWVKVDVHDGLYWVHYAEI